MLRRAYRRGDDRRVDVPVSVWRPIGD